MYKFVGYARCRGYLGRKADELSTAMLEFKSGKRPNAVMTRLAKGFSDEEIVAMSAWFAAQKD